MLKIYLISIVIWFIILISTIILLAFVYKKEFRKDLIANLKGAIMLLTISAIPIFRFLIFIFFFIVTKPKEEK